MLELLRVYSKNSTKLSQQDRHSKLDSSCLHQHGHFTGYLNRYIHTNVFISNVESVYLFTHINIQIFAQIAHT